MPKADITNQSWQLPLKPWSGLKILIVRVFRQPLLMHQNWKELDVHGAISDLVLGSNKGLLIPLPIELFVVTVLKTLNTFH